MTRTRLGLLGLCAMVFGLMAFGATGAQAEVNAKWLILPSGGGLKTGAELHAAVGLKKDTDFTLHTEILKIKVLFLCEEIEAINAKLQEQGIIGNTVITNAEGLKEGRGSQVKFTECKTFLNGVEAPKCVPTEPVTGVPKVIITKLGHALLKLHALTGLPSDDITKILPDVGDEFALVVTGPLKENECPIGTSVPVRGSLAIKDCKDMALTHLVEHLVEQFTPLTRLFVISDTVEHQATLLGSAWARLTLEHAGLLWSGDPA